MTQKQQKDDYDSPWKEILEFYFEEFIAFFFPDAYADIDWSRGYEFLDKELQQITREAETGRKYVDKLAKVWLKSGAEQWTAIHTDIQMGQEKGFDKRMYTYNYRLFDRFDVHAASFAVIGGMTGWKPGVYEKCRWGCKVRFEFPAVRLSDYADNIDSLEKSANPFAVVVLAHLKTVKSAGDKIQRRREKLALVKSLYCRGFSKQDVINLFRFIDWMMRLPEKEDKLFWSDLADYEKEKQMPYVTSVEKIGIQKGIQAGIQEGIQEGTQKNTNFMFTRMIEKKFGESPDEILQMIKPMTPQELEEIIDMFIEFESFDEFREWVRNRAGKKSANQ